MKITSTIKLSEEEHNIVTEFMTLVDKIADNINGFTCDNWIDIVTAIVDKTEYSMGQVYVDYTIDVPSKEAENE